jgi:Flp pilus assembly protein TadG
MTEERKMNLKWRNFVRETHGSVLVLTAILMAVLLGFCGLAIDVGHYMVVRNELQNAADAGALAGARALFPADLSTVTNPVTPDCSTAVTVGTQVAHWNKTDSSSTVVADIQTGHWDMVNRQFVAGCSNSEADFTNAVQVTTQRQDVPLFLMQVLGAVPKTIQASSVAAIDWVGGLKKGKGFPVAIAQKYVQPDNNTANKIDIYFNDDTCDTGCWYMPDASASDCNTTVQKVLNDPIANPMPAVSSGQEIFLSNGVIGSGQNTIGQNYVGQTVWIPVVDTIKFNQDMPVLGFCEVLIEDQGVKKGKHFITVSLVKMAQAPGDAVEGSGKDFGLLCPVRLVL